ncbi:MAG: M15 family metallopeptidase [Oscillospiraceae bacterium]
MKPISKAAARRNRMILLSVCVLLIVVVVVACVAGHKEETQEPDDSAKTSTAADSSASADSPADSTDSTGSTDSAVKDLPAIALREGQELKLDTGIYGTGDWTSSDTAVAAAGLGKVIGVSKGSCTLTNGKQGVSVQVFSGYATPAGGVPEITVVDGVTYVNGILIVNKTYSLPRDYAYGADDTAMEHLNQMFDAAAKDGLNLFIASGYRDYDTQKTLYEQYRSDSGEELADTYSARPGHSEHQSGLAFDINDPSDTFTGTPEQIWVAKHCTKYGFIIRFPEGKQDSTGYKYESWHVRYVGVEAAKEITASGKSLEEFLGITSKYTGAYLSDN